MMINIVFESKVDVSQLACFKLVRMSNLIECSNGWTNKHISAIDFKGSRTAENIEMILGAKHAR